MITPDDPAFGPMLGLLATLVALLIPAAWCSHRLSRRLRDRHPEVWNQLGEPGRFSSSIASSNTTARFVRAGLYRELRDPVVNRLTISLRVLSAVYLVCFAAFFALFLARIFDLAP